MNKVFIYLFPLIPIYVDHYLLINLFYRFPEMPIAIHSQYLPLLSCVSGSCFLTLEGGTYCGKFQKKNTKLIR